VTSSKSSILGFDRPVVSFTAKLRREFKQNYYTLDQLAHTSYGHIRFLQFSYPAQLSMLGSIPGTPDKDTKSNANGTTTRTIIYSEPITEIELSKYLDCVGFIMPQGNDLVSGTVTVTVSDHSDNSRNSDTSPSGQLPTALPHKE
jgi:hypothetical protein